MLSDLANYDLMQLALYDTVPAEKQEEMLTGFNQALMGYLAQNLNQYFSDESDQEYQQLSIDKNTTDEQVQDFYRKYIPNTDETIDEINLRP